MKIRTFIAVEIGALDTLVDFEKELSECGIHAKLVEPENIHITLKFLGDTEEELIPEINDILTESVKGIEPFKLTFKGAGVFPNLNYIKVLWVGIEDPGPLPEIGRKLDSGLKIYGFKPEKRGFTPHITLGRVKSQKGKEKLRKLIMNNVDRNFGGLEVNKLFLKKSIINKTGPTYFNIGEVSLVG